MNSTQHVIVGKFGKTYGVKGEISVHPYTDPATNILDYGPLYVNIKGSWQKLEQLTFKYNGKHFLMSLKEYASPETVSVLTNAEISIRRNQLKPLKQNEYYCIDLLGMIVKNSAGFEYGEVLEVLPTGSNDVLIVKSKISDKKYLIPYISPQYINSVDQDNKIIIADWDPEF